MIAPLQASAPKAPGSPDRCVPIEETARLLPALCTRFGITRVGDTSRLDRTGIPTYCAIVPKSCDVLGVYNGKGRTPEAARVSAIMEAFERQAAANAELANSPLSIEEVLRFLDLEQLELREDVRELTVPCTFGTDLLSGERVPVPHALIRFPWRGTKLLARTSTNGLASGNNVIEAIYHALMEMVERHVWSLFYVRSELVPKFYEGALASDNPGGEVLEVPTGNDYLDGLFEAVRIAGLSMRVVFLREGSLPYVVLACVLEHGSEPPMAHVGVGCSLSPLHAVERAVTEAIQSRVVDVQGAREDIIRANDVTTRKHHGRRLAALPRNRWYVDVPTATVRLADIPNRASYDIASDLQKVISEIRDAGIRRAVWVDISPPDQPFAAVRIVAPDFETSAVDGRLGALAQDEFNPLKSRLLHQRREPKNDERR